MSKMMSILEKYSLIEKVNKGEQPDINLNEEEDTILSEVTNDEVIITDIENNSIGIKKQVPVVRADMEYEKIMTLNEIYSQYELKESSINTVFMLQNLINALPQDLPKDVVKQSVINIVATSNIDLNELVSDGEKRKEILADVINGYNNATSTCIVKYKEEIAKLSKIICNFQEQIAMKESMLEEQMHIIKYEAQRINGIIDFFSK